MRNKVSTIASAHETTGFDPNLTPLPSRSRHVAEPVNEEVLRMSADRSLHSELKEEASGTITPVRGASDTLTIYLREIGSVPRLNASEEAALALRVQRGDDAAREQMITANLRLVVRIARNYVGLGLPLLDLISEGNIGLMTAVERFDPRKGARLSTYAAIWIRQTIRRAIANQGRTIRLPVYVVDVAIRMHQIASRLEGALGREPSDAELGNAMDMPPARVAHLRSAVSRLASLDATIDEDNLCLGDIITDERSCWTPSQAVEQQTQLDGLAEIFKTLKPREQLVLRERFGLNSDAENTLEAIGQRLRLTRERIRQIERNALAKLRKKLRERDALEAVARPRPVKTAAAGSSSPSPVSPKK
jgi:RNA polymerase primary sigma factor